MSARTGLLLGTGASLLSACAAPHSDTLAAFERTLIAHASATAALREWCAARGIAPATKIVARPLHDDDAAAPGDLRGVLRIGADEPVGYRHVALACGDTVLSVAHNWYVPGRLTPEMNAQLAASDTPFGTVAAALRFTRARLTSAEAAGTECPAGTVLTQRALLSLPDGRPLSLLVECYSPAVLGGS
ncbi:MAG: hypothetical protein JF593_07675 [Novosphingobium sp.]|nr:hypothetical protein [Novosphingobium sp.]